MKWRRSHFEDIQENFVFLTWLTFLISIWYLPFGKIDPAKHLTLTTSWCSRLWALILLWSKSNAQVWHLTILELSEVRRKVEKRKKKKEKEKFKNWVSTISRRMREWERRKKKRKRKRKRKKERKRNENENGNVRNWKEPWSWENKFPPLPKFNLGDWVYSVQWDE